MPSAPPTTLLVETRTRLAVDVNEDSEDHISPLPSRLSRKARHEYIHQLRVGRLRELATQALVDEMPRVRRVLDSPAKARLRRCVNDSRHL